MSGHKLANKVRFVTATSLFDGHDASINIFRRILQASGAEVIHLGHNRSGLDIVEAAIQEDAHAIAVTSYQGGHMEFYRYLVELLTERDATHIRIFGGGGGTILPREGEELAGQGVTRIYSPDDGREMGLTGMVADMLCRSDYPLGELSAEFDPDKITTETPAIVARLISAAENYPDKYADIWESIEETALQSTAPVVGITGTGGSGKSSLVDELVRRFLMDFEGMKIAIISVDPSKRRSGGALLGDRIRMNSLPHPRVYMRSLATRQSNLALSPHVQHALNIVKAAGYDLVLLETSGIGQSDTEIVDYSDHALYVMTPEYGAATQLEKIDMLDFADMVSINKADKQGAEDALRDVRKQYKRNHLAFDASDDDLPVYLTIASDFNDPGTNRFYEALTSRLGLDSTLDLPLDTAVKLHVVPPERSRYLAEIVEEIRRYDRWAQEQSDAAERLYRLEGVADDTDVSDAVAAARERIDSENLKRLERWDGLVAEYSGEEFVYHVRGKEVRVPLHTETLSHTRIPKVALPSYRSWGDRLHWMLTENVPGEFPFTAGVYPFRRSTEDPTRMFAGEGPPEQTNTRFHYLSEGMPAKRLSTAFDSVTLYGDEPNERPDIYGKVGNSGVSIATIDDAKKLYSGFDLSDPATSVSMTINGPAPMILAFFMNTAIDQACEKYITENDLWDEVEAKIDGIYGHRPRPLYHGELPSGHDGLGLRLLGVAGDQVLPTDVYNEIKEATLSRVRGTVQADILKEDQAQNTCIFSTEFALRMMGD
ncbi:MAG TPA: methylmalonyl-CoA mutase family protein, partial [Acidimicrobiia bacterium]|nr:methylmalonyl-CoA mutase family protein [Acidimicrobiia bacterium]